MDIDKLIFRVESWIIWKYKDGIIKNTWIKIKVLIVIYLLILRIFEKMLELKKDLFKESEKLSNSTTTLRTFLSPL